MSHINSFRQQVDLIKKFGEGNAYLVWALSLYLDFSNPIELGSESLTDGTNDKKIDFIRYESDSRRVVCAQGYFSSKKVDAAPANKASDLNTAAAWIFSGDLNSVPEFLRTKIREIREAINSGEVDEFSFVYVHNLPESNSVNRELDTLKSYVEMVLPENCAATVVSKEIGFEEVERFFSERESHIRVNDSVKCPGKPVFKQQGPNWNAVVLSVPGAWLRGLFLKYGDDLYSANYRGFLGTNKRKKINTGIRQTAESDPNNFWVYNNGITILTRGIKEARSAIELNGISIINGAQTSGSLGSVDSAKSDLTEVQVLCRLIECSDQETIGSIVRFNNTQNEITTWDQYSNNPEQHRIKMEFDRIGYNYSLKRGFESAAADVSIESVASPLLAFGGNYRDANIGKNYIFDTKSLYKATFDGRKARHILLVATCSAAIDALRSELRRKVELGTIIEIESKQLELFQSMRFKNFLIALIGRVLPVVTGRASDAVEIAFSPLVASQAVNNFGSLVIHWTPFVKTMLTYCAATIHIPFSEYVKKEKALDEVASAVGGLLYAAKIQNSDLFSEFSSLVVES